MSETWDGRGLPPVASERLARAGRSSLATSLLSVPSAVGVRVVGLDAVGEVMGCMVLRIGWQGWSGCGQWGTSSRGLRTATPVSGFQPYVSAVRSGYDTALSRLAQEAAALQAHGVVGIRLSVSKMEHDTFEYVAMGTAVRFVTAGNASTPRLFLTDLPGTQVAALLMAGWLPTDILYGISLTIRHDDWAVYAQTRFLTGNTEVDGFTQLTTHGRRQARESLQSRALRAGVDGVLVTSQTMRVWEQEPSDGHRDHLAEVRMFGSGVVRFGSVRSPSVSPLSILPLKG